MWWVLKHIILDNILGNISSWIIIDSCELMVRNVYMENTTEDMLFILAYISNQLERNAKRIDENVYFNLLEKFNGDKEFTIDKEVDLVVYRQRIDTLIKYFDDRIQEFFFENIEYEEKIDWDSDKYQRIYFTFLKQVGGVELRADYILHVKDAEPTHVTYFVYYDNK